MKKAGVLYDNISGNTGDVAIGLTVKKILREIKVEFDELVPGRFNPRDYDRIIIGGGHLLRPSPDFFYDKFKVLGNHILNACGILGSPSDLHYLNDYEYVSVRSTGDKKKLEYLKRDVKVVPCTSMLLDEAGGFNLPIKKPSLGIHISPGVRLLDADRESSFVRWISSLGFNIYFLPITHYMHDFTYLEGLGSKIRDSKVLPILKPPEIFAAIGQFDYFITCSLHGAIFSYVHNVPFIPFDLEKIKFFMMDRGLEQYLFDTFEGMKVAFNRILDNSPDYTERVARDKEILHEHIEHVKEALSGSVTSSSVELTPDKRDLIDQLSCQTHFLQSQIMELKTENKILTEELNNRTNENKILTEELNNTQSNLAKQEMTINAFRAHLLQVENELRAIRLSFGYKVMKFYASKIDMLFPEGTRRGDLRKRAVTGLRTLMRD